MLEERFEALYLQFRVNFIRRALATQGEREESLTTSESFCVEIIHLLDRPTITQFAGFLGVSIPNATYKINSLVKKGYVLKLPSDEDRREYHLQVTDKFLSYYGLNNEDNARLMRDIRSTFSEPEIAQLETVIDKVINLMAKEDTP